MYTKNTKIVCTLGPSSNSVSEITKLVQAGMNVARLNFSHGDHPGHLELINNIHKVEKITGKTIGIIQDLQGPKIRLGKLPTEGLTLKKGENITLTTKNIVAKKEGKTFLIPIQLKNFNQSLKIKESIFINDGLVEVVITSKAKDHVKCKIKCGGFLKSNAGVHLPDSMLTLNPLTEKDKKDLKFGLKNKVDYVALSFVKSANDIEVLRKLIKKSGKDTKIIAKIERHEAIKNLEEIIKASDGIMVARGDLGIDIPPEHVPIIQKRIISLSNKYAKPVITATEVLLSMVVSPRATRAEISDAANAVFDRTDAIMLSNESAVGKYPSKATATLSKVATSVEDELQKYEYLKKNPLFSQHSEYCNPHCQSACELSIESKANLLVVYTSNGFSAREIAKHRIYTEIVTLTPSKEVARELTLVWGLNKIFTFRLDAKDKNRVEKVSQFLIKKHLAKKNDKVVIILNASKKEKLISTIKL